MTQNPADECCSRFDPAPWDGKELVWEGRRFVKDRVRSVFHIPLDFGALMRRNMARIEAAGALARPVVVLCDENSLWGADVYIAVTADVPAATMATISGTFLCKVFEGPYSRVRTWIKEMHAFVLGRGKALRRLYVFYTTCPKCAKKYGKNYVAIMAQV